MSVLKLKIFKRMDELQEMMESNRHLEDPDGVQEHLYSVSKFWSVLSEEDRDYIQCAQHSVEEKTVWKK